MWGRVGMTQEEARQKVIHTCWRCNSFGKIVNMDLGLCQNCIEVLRDPEFVKFWAPQETKDGPRQEDA